MRSHDGAPPQGGREPGAGEANRLRAAIAPAWQTRDMGLLLAARASMSAARALASVLVPIYLTILGLDAVQLGALVTLVALVSAGLSALIGLAADRIGRKPFLVALPLLTASAAVVFGLAHAVPVLFMSAALGSFGRGAAPAPARARWGRISPPSRRTWPMVCRCGTATISSGAWLSCLHWAR